MYIYLFEFLVDISTVIKARLFVPFSIIFFLILSIFLDKQFHRNIVSIQNRLMSYMNKTLQLWLLTIFLTPFLPYQPGFRKNKLNS